MKKNMEYDEIDEVNNKTRVSKMITYVCLSLSLVTIVSYFIYTVVTSNNLVDRLATIVSISSNCSSIGLSCKFTYGGYNNSVAKDVATNQSKRGGSVVGRGTSITITLSSGKPGTCSARIIEEWLTQGNASASMSSIKSKLSSQCPGVNFNVVGKPDNSAPVGMLHPNSPIKGEQYNFVQGQTYTIWIVQ